MQLTQRQEWKVLRDLVSENNSTLKSIFSSAVSADIYDFYYRKTTAGTGVSKQTVQSIKSYKISNGVREIYKACADNFLKNDFYGGRKYLDFQDSGVNWLDKLSTTDLFYYYALQSRVINGFNKADSLNVKSAVEIIGNTPLGKYFSGKVEFTGKPEKTPEDKQKIDVKDLDLRAQVLHDVALREHKNYCEKNNLDSEESEEFVMTKTNFGKYSGLVTNRYFKQREFLRKEQEENEKFLNDQRVLEREKPEWVGFDIYQSPLYRLSNGIYQTSTGEDYSGDILELVDDRFVVVANTNEDEKILPTDESEIEEIDTPSLQTPLFKRDVEVLNQTHESGQEQ